MKPACTAGTCQTQTSLSVHVKHLVKQTGKIKRAFLLNWLQILNKTGAYHFHLHQQLFRPARVVFLPSADREFKSDAPFIVFHLTLGTCHLL